MDSYKVYNSKFLVSIQITLNETKLLRIQGTDHEGQISWDWNQIFNHEVKILLFHEIKTNNNIDQEVSTSILRSKPKQALLQILISWSFLWLTNQEIKTQNKALLGNFDLMIYLLATGAIMRSKVFMHRWLIIRAKNLPQVQLTKFK